MSDSETASQERRIAEFEELSQLALALVSSLNDQDTLSAIADSCLRLSQAERVALLLFSLSPDQEARTLIRRSDHAEADIDHIVNIHAAKTFLSNPEPFITDNIIQRIKLDKPSRKAKNLGPALVCPLFVNGELIGIINLVNSKGGRRFNEESLRVMSLVSKLASQYIHRARLHEALFQDTVRLKELLHDRAGPAALLGEAPSMKELRRKIELAAKSASTVLLIGETGTGKELAARALHYGGDRAEKPFVAVNCAAIPLELFESELFGHEKGAFTGAGTSVKGKFELANKGTLFLDEISSMPLSLQPKLLRVLEQKAFYRVGSDVETTVDVRLIAATSVDLARAVGDGSFRRELYHRLSVVPVELPPLRERTGDIPILAREFIKEISGGAKKFAGETLDFLCKFPWNGNVRELRNAVERISIFVSSPLITPSDVQALGIGSDAATGSLLRTELKRAVAGNRGQKNLIDSIEKDLVELAMEQSGGNLKEAAAILGIDRLALRRRVEKFGGAYLKP
jgi:transcriptional regulator with GAF, ATPase, and Fis domain